ncbi:hypothetical protein TRSC58_05249 [Trypanosoma rangeli SC58]|uniref:Uncharacterized protein n=1 Tax=Trypanosoma rangeli SC58 TaxID=429131 RepID=A0A061IVD1_TRYRA|nr:hypothetical protein TRSC58_05249 [Trypanosoma rangeli SC58]
MSRKSKAPPGAVDETEEMRVGKFGRFLYESFDQTFRPSVFDLQLRYYGDYLHHFGFSMEAETKGRRRSFLSDSKSATSPNVALSPLHEAVAHVDDPVADAGWGIAEEERKEADAQARAVGPLDVSTKLEEMTMKVVEPFQRVTWRQSMTQCAMKKARALYCWLCENITVEIRLPPAVAEEEAAAAAKKEVGGKGNAASRNLKRKAGTDAQLATAPVEVVDPFVTVMQERTTDPLMLARLYQKCLHHAKVESKVVEGRVRGRAPEETIEWAWNIVSIPQEEDSVKRYLVDVALSSYTGPLRHVTRSKDVVEEMDAVKESNLKGTPPAKSNRPIVISNEKPTRSPIDAPALVSSRSAKKRMESFYFNTHPQQFCATHFPKTSLDTLLLTPPRQVAWEDAPCLTHTFFRFPLALSSHRRRCFFTVRSTPFYISFVNEKPERVELTCFIYKGTLEMLPEDLSTATPLGPQWVWHQREETTSCETFTLMVPEAGYYGVVVGARDIRQDPFTAVISEELFVPVVAYQVLVTFVPDQVPRLPRQYFTPSVCKLLAPLTHQLPEGVTQFVVMPSCANVAGVAVVSRQSTEGTRDLLAFLPFSSKLVAYTGEVTLTSGCEVEVWILYAAPDHNYVNTTELPRVEPSFRHQVSLACPDADASCGVTPPPTTTGTKSVFLPFVTGIAVKKFGAAGKGVCHIQPQPTLEDEQQPTLRRLIGVTPELFREAAAAISNKSRPVGSYFERKVLVARRAAGDV